MRQLVVKCTSGVDDAEVVNQAFTVAAAGIAAGAEVSLWLTGDAVWLALPGRAEEFRLDMATPLAELRDLVLNAGIVTVCSQCAARRGIDANQVVRGVSIAGAALFVEQALTDGTQVLVY